MSFLGDIFGSSQLSSTATDPDIKNLLLGNYATAKDVANIPFTPYTGERVAPFTQTGLLGQQSLINAANNPTGTNTINSAGGILSGVANYQPGSLKTTNISDYANPYTNDVVNATLGDLSHAYGETKVADNAAATAAKAFGGTRQAVQRANTTDDYLRTVARTSGDLRSNAFDRAQNAAQFDIGTGLQGAGLRLNAGNSLSSLGDAQLRDALTRAGVIQQVGNQQQTLGQAQDDAAYEEFLRQINYPTQQQNVRNSALGLLPKDSTTTARDNGSVAGNVGKVLGLAALAGL